LTGQQRAPGAHAHGGQVHTHDQSHRLSAFLCWAVVFADIGTSVYYTPGILYNTPGIGRLAGLFVSMTMVAFILLAIKYAEVSVRFPEGGGVVTVSARALNPWFGALGGMFILVDYFLTAAISSLSGLQYFQDIIPAIAPYVLPATIIVLVLLGALNWWGIKESAVVSAVIAVAAFVSDMVIIAAVLLWVPLPTIGALIGEMFHGGQLTGVTLLTGFAGAFLAFSGLESISQLSPVMRLPRRKTVTIALGIVVITVGLTSPLLTIFSTLLLDGQHNNLLAHPVPNIDPNQFISQLGQAYGGPILGTATAITASALLIFASNTAIIGAYHVFMALSHMSFFPKAVLKLEPRRGTPLYSIMLATGIPVVILILAQGQIDLLGQLYAFGLLGAFALTCISLDVLRFRELRGKRQIAFHEEEEYDAPAYASLEADHLDEIELGASTTTPTAGRRFAHLWHKIGPRVNFVVGVLTTLMVATAWVTNLIVKRDATIFGGGLTMIGMAIAIWHYRREESSGRNTILPSWVTSYAPDTQFVVLQGDSKHNREVIESALYWARGRKVLFYFLADLAHVQPRRWQIEVQSARDSAAQAAFRTAFQLAERTRTPIQVFYSNGGAHAAVWAWRVSQSRDVVAEPELAREFTKHANPSFIGYRIQDGVRVAHCVFLDEQTLDYPTVVRITETPTPLVAAPARPSPTNAGAEDSEETEEYTIEDYDRWEQDSDTLPRRRDTASTPRVALVPDANGAHSASGVSAGQPRYPIKIMQPRSTTQLPRNAPSSAVDHPAVTPPQAESEADSDDEYSSYTWTGDDLIRKDEQ
jgi:amino acid transporter